MIRFFILMIVFSFSNAFAASPFESLVGCYNTVKWNDKPTNSDYISEITLGDSMIALNMDNSTMPAVEMFLFQQEAENSINYGYAYPLIGQGSNSITNDGAIFSFDGQVRYRFQPEYIGTLLHKVEYKKLSNGNVWIHNYIKVKETNAFDVDETYELKLTACN